MASSDTTSILIAVLLVSYLAEAKVFLVGGNTDAWKVPSSPAQSLNRWADANRFEIGDTLVWKINGNEDTVLQVTGEGYLSCNVSAPLAVPEIKDGGVAKVKLERPGAYYFISGKKDACEMGQRMIVVVMSPRSSTMIMSPAPSPVEEENTIPPVVVSGVGRLAVAGPVIVGGLLALGLM